MSRNEEQGVVGYKPSVFYFRRALRRTEDPDLLREIGLTLCAAYEAERAWIRSMGLIPPKEIVLPEEAIEKGWQFESGFVEHPNQIRFPFDA